MKKTFNNQCERVLKYMRDFGQITSLDAVKDLGVMSLSRRICDLKERGVAINTHIEKSVNRYGENTHFVVYELAEG